MKNIQIATACCLLVGSLFACSTNTVQMKYQAEEALTLADSRKEVGYWQDALAKYDAVLAKSPDDWEANAGRGHCLLKMGNVQPAETSLRRAYALVGGAKSPISVRLSDDIAKAKVLQKDQDGFIEFTQEQIKKSHGNRDYLRSAQGLAAFGDMDGALSDLNKAEIAAWDEGDQRRYESYLAIADFYNTVHDQPSALRYTRYAAFMNHNMPEVQARLTKLGRVVGPTEWMDAPPSKEDLEKGYKPEVVETK